jgi:hypothetical protein
VSATLRRVVVFVLAVGSVAGLWRRCAGWAATAEARMSCCDRMAMCPMRKPVRDGSALKVTQAAADSCCAASDRPETAPSSITVVAAPPLVPVLLLFAEPPAVAPVAMAGWHGPPPLVASRQLPRHLLLSVFLI